LNEHKILDRKLNGQVSHFDDRLLCRRDTFRIIANILSVAMAGARITEIVYRANLNFKECRRYLRFLQAKGLISTDKNSKGKTYFILTDKGRRFLELYQDIMKLFSS